MDTYNELRERERERERERGGGGGGGREPMIAVQRPVESKENLHVKMNKLGSKFIKKSVHRQNKTLLNMRKFSC